jgi:ribosome-binding factor A
MSSHRSLRMAEAIREVVASAILFEAADPRIQAVTVLRVEVSGDLRQATIYVSVMGTAAEQTLAMRGLKHAAGFLQSRVAARLQTRFTPVLSFKLDDSVKKSIEIGRLIDQAVASDRKPDPTAEESCPSTVTDSTLGTAPSEVPGDHALPDRP